MVAFFDNRPWPEWSQLTSTCWVSDGNPCNCGGDPEIHAVLSARRLASTELRKLGIRLHPELDRGCP